MIVYICDKCGKQFPSVCCINGGCFDLTDIKNGRNEIIGQVCKDCNEKLFDWFEHKVKTMDAGCIDTA